MAYPMFSMPILPGGEYGSSSAFTRRKDRSRTRSRTRSRSRSRSSYEQGYRDPTRGKRSSENRRVDIRSTSDTEPRHSYNSIRSSGRERVLAAKNRPSEVRSILDTEPHGPYKAATPADRDGPSEVQSFLYTKPHERHNAASPANNDHLPEGRSTLDAKPHGPYNVASPTNKGVVRDRPRGSDCTDGTIVRREPEQPNKKKHCSHETGTHQWKVDNIDDTNGFLRAEGCLCPCITYGRTNQRLKRIQKGFSGIDFEVEQCNLQCFLCALGSPFCLYGGCISDDRQEIRILYNIKGTHTDDLIESCCCPCGAVIQHEREVFYRERQKKLIDEQPGPCETMQTPRGSPYDIPANMSSPNLVPRRPSGRTPVPPLCHPDEGESSLSALFSPPSPTRQERPLPSISEASTDTASRNESRKSSGKGKDKMPARAHSLSKDSRTASGVDSHLHDLGDRRHDARTPAEDGAAVEMHDIHRDTVVPVDHEPVLHNIHDDPIARVARAPDEHQLCQDPTAPVETEPVPHSVHDDPMTLVGTHHMPHSVHDDSMAQTELPARSHSLTSDERGPVPSKARRHTIGQDEQDSVPRDEPNQHHLRDDQEVATTKPARAQHALTEDSTALTASAKFKPHALYMDQAVPTEVHSEPHDLPSDSSIPAMAISSPSQDTLAHNSSAHPDPTPQPKFANGVPGTFPESTGSPGGSDTIEIRSRSPPPSASASRAPPRMIRATTNPAAAAPVSSTENATLKPGGSENAAAGGANTASPAFSSNVSAPHSGARDSPRGSSILNSLFGSNRSKSVNTPPPDIHNNGRGEMGGQMDGEPQRSHSVKQKIVHFENHEKQENQ